MERSEPRPGDRNGDGGGPPLLLARERKYRRFATENDSINGEKFKMSKKNKKSQKRKSRKFNVSRNVDSEPDLILDLPFGTGDDDLGDWLANAPTDEDEEDLFDLFELRIEDGQALRAEMREVGEAFETLARRFGELREIVREILARMPEA